MADGGGGLILDLTPDFWVTLQGYKQTFVITREDVQSSEIV